jgi:hypothetical protein
MQTGDRFPCFVGSVTQVSHYNDKIVKATAEAHSASNLLSYFPVQVWESCVMIGNPDPRTFEPFDGIIRYSCHVYDSHRRVDISGHSVSVWRLPHLASLGDMALN